MCAVGAGIYRVEKRPIHASVEACEEMERMGLQFIGFVKTAT